MWLEGYSFHHYQALRSADVGRPLLIVSTVAWLLMMVMLVMLCRA